MTKTPEHRAEMEARALRRAARAQRAWQEGPTPVKMRPRRETTDVAKVSKAKFKRDRKAMIRFRSVAATAMGRRR